MRTKKIFTILLFVLTALPKTGWGQNKLEESVFAHISKNIAVTGETIWFSMQALDADQNFYSKIGYAELVDRNGQPVHQVIYPLHLGKSEGYIEIPKDLESDHYLLRFYTRISPKMGQKGVFSQFITVINPNKPSKAKATTQTGKTYPPIKASNLDQGKVISMSKKSNTDLDLTSSNLGKVSSISISIANPFLPENDRATGRCGQHDHSGPLSGLAAWSRDAGWPFQVFARAGAAARLQPEIAGAEYGPDDGPRSPLGGRSQGRRGLLGAAG